MIKHRCVLGCPNLLNIFRYEPFWLFMAVSQVSDAKTWETDVISSDIPVFVDFWAEWCGPCRMVGPVIEELANDYDGKVKFVKVNVDEANELASKYNVFSIPTFDCSQKWRNSQSTSGCCI